MGQNFTIRQLKKEGANGHFTVLVERAVVQSSFALAKVERSKLYPSRKRMALDPTGQPCSRAALMSDCITMLRSGMTAQGYLTDGGRWVTKDEMVGICLRRPKTEPLD